MVLKGETVVTVSDLKEVLKAKTDARGVPGNGGCDVEGGAASL